MLKDWLGDTHPRKLLKIAMDWGMVLTGLVVVQGVTALSPVIVARRVSPAEFGQFAACAGLLSLFVAFPNFGLEHWLLAQGGATREQVGALWRGAMKLRLLLLGGWAMIMIALGLFLPQDTYPLLLFALTALWLVVDSLAYPCFAALRLLSQHHAVTGLQALTALGVLAALLFFPANPVYLITFAVVRVVIEAIGTGAVIGFTHTRLPNLNSEVPLPIRHLWRVAQPFMIGDVAVLVYSRSDSAILSLVGGKNVMAFYGPAASIVAMTFIVGAAVYYFVLPGLGRAHQQNNPAAFLQKGVLQLCAQMGLGLGLMGGVLLTAPTVIPLVFGNAYAMTVPVLQLMSPVIFIKFVNFGLAAFLTGGQNQNRRAQIQVFLAFLNVITTLIGAVGWGLVGAVMVDILTEVCMTVGYLLGIWRLVGEWHTR